MFIEKKDLFEEVLKLVEGRSLPSMQRSTHRFIVQTLSCYWSIPLRNAIFKFIYLNERYSSLAMALSKEGRDLLLHLLRSEEFKESVAQKSASPKLYPEDIMSTLLTEGGELVKSEVGEMAKRQSVSVPEPDEQIGILMSGTLFNVQVHFDPAKEAGSETVEESHGSCILVSPKSSFTIKGFCNGAEEYHQWQTKVFLESVEFFVALRQDFTEWPCFLPLEYLVEFAGSFGKFHKLIDRTNGMVQIVKYTANLADDVEMRKILSFPKMAISMTSVEYCILYDVITNLLIYNEPLRMTRVEQIDSLLLAMDLYDIESLIESLGKLKSNLGQTIEVFRGTSDRLYKSGSTVSIGDPDMTKFDLKPAKDRQKIEASLLSSLKKKRSMESELSNLNDAIRIFSARKRTSTFHLKSNLDFFSEFVDLRLNDGSTFCEATLENLAYLRVDDEDGSATNSIEIARLLVYNKMRGAVYKELIKPYMGIFPSNSFSSGISSAVRDTNFEKVKMIRYFSRLLAPVGGITVIEHAEINLFPLSISISKDITQKLVSFFYESPVVAQKESVAPAVEKRKLSDELATMKARAAETKSFVYIKVPGTYHCISYRGDSSIADINQFLLKLPEYEYRNQTCSWLDLLEKIKKGSLIREKVKSIARGSKKDDEIVSPKKSEKDSEVADQKGKLLFGKRFTQK